MEQAISRLEPPNNSKFSVIYSTYSLKENQVKFHLAFKKTCPALDFGLQSVCLPEDRVQKVEEGKRKDWYTSP